MSDLINKQLGPYQLKEVIRRGGMGTIYKAYQPMLDRYVAVKVQLANRDPQFAIRFQREARAVAQLQHPNIVPVYDYNEQNGLFFLAMQYIEGGRSLSDVLGTPIEPARALRIIIQVLSALAYAHSRGVIHRDIKPGNVLLTADNWPMITDFGIAKVANDNLNLTMPGTAIGTPAYIAPEQAEGRSVDQRTDLYALGVVLYEMVTGQVPFDADTPMAVLMKHVYEPPASPRSVNPSLPQSVEVALLKTLAKDPGQRFQSADEMARELERVVNQLTQPPKEQEQVSAASLYTAGVQAIEAARWDTAVDQLSRLAELDPDYEDGADLLAFARDEQARLRSQAQERLSQIRQQRSSTVSPQVATPPPPLDPRRTERLQDEDLAAVVRRQESAAPAAHAAPAVPQPVARADQTPAPVAAAMAQPATPAPEAPAAPRPTGSTTARLSEEEGKRRSPLVWIVLGAVLLLIVLALILSRYIGGADSGTPQPTAAADIQQTPAEAAPTAAEAAPTAAEAAPTAAQQAGPPPPDPVGTLVIEDDFATPELSGLPNAPDDAALASSFDPSGVYRIGLKTAGELHAALLPRIAVGNFSVQVEVKNTSADPNGNAPQGLVFRAQNSQTFYTALIDANRGAFAVLRQDDTSGTTDLLPIQESPLINKQDAVNTLRVDGTGDTFSVYVNNSLLASFTDSTYASGMLGLAVASDDAATPQADFDNLMIWSEPSAAASNLPATKDTPDGQMVLIPGGNFILGSNLNSNEGPPQLVELPDFYIDRAEVTITAYLTCVDVKGCAVPPNRDSATRPGYNWNVAEFGNYPVINITWQEAQFYCEAQGKRLPTEAEWEKAASWNAATNQKSIWPWGNQFDPERLNSSEGGAGDTGAVDQFEAESNNTLGMGGNVAEWTSTLFKAYPYAADDGREDPAASGARVVRGGTWNQGEGSARTSSREPITPDVATNELGFRCASDA